ncbi:TAXI family TRAP transporter solute-binding subunit [Bacillus sp. Marseille-P3661]|uniref:TAXI family TRAP transporter solute-binding subunit n=1 Tax=Bacillus sp. Marseille-P3661 TaxID=1936234 RepID=UPI000C847AD6|nr:TAXI family TRAP transporter solute-binding subunit [Bacillus sp. Marseille-P3661]
MKRLSFLMLLILVMGFVLFGCGGNSTETSGNSATETSGETKTETTEEAAADATGGVSNVRIGTATTSGFYYPLGGALAQTWTNHDFGNTIRFSAQATDGGVQNVNLMIDGEIEMGMTNLNVLQAAYDGKEAFEGRAYQDVRIMSTLFPSAIQIVAREGSEIDSIADIKGKKMVPGAPGSTTQYAIKDLFETYGMDLDKDVEAQYVGYTQAVEFMRNKQTDSFSVLSSIPVAAISEATLTADAKLLAIEEENLQKYIEKDSTFYKEIIPAGSYEGQDTDIVTLAQPNVLFIPKDLPDELVYEMTKSMWEGIDKMRESFPQLNTMKVENAASNIGTIPLHPGAEQYYKEIGLIK